jgi:hypothetical protein
MRWWEESEGNLRNKTLMVGGRGVQGVHASCIWFAAMGFRTSYCFDKFILTSSNLKVDDNEIDLFSTTSVLVHVESNGF